MVSRAEGTGITCTRSEGDSNGRSSGGGDGGSGGGGSIAKERKALRRWGKEKKRKQENWRWRWWRWWRWRRNDGKSNSRGKEGNDIVSHLSARLRYICRKLYYYCHRYHCYFFVSFFPLQIDRLPSSIYPENFHRSTTYRIDCMLNFISTYNTREMHYFLIFIYFNNYYPSLDFYHESCFGSSREKFKRYVFSI